MGFCCGASQPESMKFLAQIDWGRPVHLPMISATCKWTITRNFVECHQQLVLEHPWANFPARKWFFLDSTCSRATVAPLSPAQAIKIFNVSHPKRRHITGRDRWFLSRLPRHKTPANLVVNPSCFVWIYLHDWSALSTQRPGTGTSASGSMSPIKNSCGESNPLAMGNARSGPAGGEYSIGVAAELMSFVVIRIHKVLGVSEFCCLQLCHIFPSFSHHRIGLRETLENPHSCQEKAWFPLQIFPSTKPWDIYFPPFSHHLPMDFQPFSHDVPPFSHGFSTIFPMIFSPPVAPTEGGAGKARRSTALAALTSAVKLRCSSASCGKGREALVAEGYYAFFYVVFFFFFFFFVCVFMFFFVFIFIFI